MLLVIYSLSLFIISLLIVWFWCCGLRCLLLCIIALLPCGCFWVTLFLGWLFCFSIYLVFVAGFVAWWWWCVCYVLCWVAVLGGAGYSLSRGI